MSNRKWYKNTVSTIAIDKMSDYPNSGITTFRIVCSESHQWAHKMLSEFEVNKILADGKFIECEESVFLAAWERTPIKTVTCDSGLKGSQYRLHESYESFAEFEYYDLTYKIASRLGYRNAEEAWKDNPLIQSSVNPSDLKIVKKGH